MIAFAFVGALLVANVAAAASWAIGDSTDISLLHEISNLDAPTLLVLFIVLLYKRKLVWGYQLDDVQKELSEWKAAAQGRTREAEEAATIAEAALHAGIRNQARRRGR